MTLPLSKTLDPADFAEMVEELAIVDRHFTRAAEQHPMRKWEYAMALRAIGTWVGGGSRNGRRGIDVGGAGSPFEYIATDWDRSTLSEMLVLDPQAPGHQTLAGYLAGFPQMWDVVTCLSVLEHVEDLDQFLYHLSCLVAPGGLLFLTMDYCDASIGAAADRYHFHWMRRRIFNAYTLGVLVAGELLRRDFQHLGDADLTWHGPQVFDYSFASLALVKRS